MMKQTELERELSEVIEGADFVEAASALTLVLAAIAFRHSKNDREAVSQLFHNIADNLPNLGGERSLN